MLMSSALVLFAAEQAEGGNSVTVILPLGVVTTMLVAIFTLFLKDSARNDSRADMNNAKLVAAAEAERDRMVAAKQAELDRALAKVAQLEQQLVDARGDAETIRVEVENRCAAQVERKEAEWNRAKRFLYDRIGTLETALYGEKRTVEE